MINLSKYSIHSSCGADVTECLGALLNEYSPDTVKSGQPIIFDAVVPFFGVELAIIKEKVMLLSSVLIHLLYLYHTLLC